MTIDEAEGDASWRIPDRVKRQAWAWDEEPLQRTVTALYDTLYVHIFGQYEKNVRTVLVIYLYN